MPRYLILPFLFHAAVAPLAAQTTPFTKVADTATPIPGGAGTFNNFSFFGNGIEDGRLAFRGSEVLLPSTFLQNGIYAFAEGNC